MRRAGRNRRSNEQIRWLGGLVSRTIHRGFGPKIAKLLYAPTDVGPAGISQIVARPDLVRRFPRAVQDWLRKRSIRPAGARWLVSRLRHVPMHLGRVVASAIPKATGSKYGSTMAPSEFSTIFSWAPDIAWMFPNTISFQRNLPNPFIASTDTRI